MRRSLIFTLALVALAGTSVRAAEEWGIEHEKAVRFEAKVVDILCELSGDCPANCGGGKRQLGLLRDGGKLLLVAKNSDSFAGGANDLIGFCGKKIIADGLLISDPLMTIFALQYKRLAPDGKWSGATQFRRDWAKRHGTAWDSDKTDQWFRHDETVKALIEKDGVFGIPGLEPETD